MNESTDEQMSQCFARTGGCVSPHCSASCPRGRGFTVSTASKGQRPARVPVLDVLSGSRLRPGDPPQGPVSVVSVRDLVGGRWGPGWPFPGAGIPVAPAFRVTLGQPLHAGTSASSSVPCTGPFAIWQPHTWPAGHWESGCAGQAKGPRLPGSLPQAGQPLTLSGGGSASGHPLPPHHSPQTQSSPGPHLSPPQVRLPG